MFWIGAFAGYVLGFFLALVFVSATMRWRAEEHAAQDSAAQLAYRQPLQD